MTFIKITYEIDIKIKTKRIFDMETYEIKNELFNRLDATNLLDEPGAALYSGDETLTKGTYLFFGLNPGGVENEIQTIKQHFEKQGKLNEYCDGTWAPGGNKMSPGTAPLQKRIQFLFASLARNPRNICATNLVLKRSRSTMELPNFQILAQQCWSFHQKLFEIVDPDVVLVMGNEGFDFLLTKLSNKTDVFSISSGHGDWMCKSVFGRIEGRERNIVCLPHLSRYAINKHPEVVEWIKSLTAGLTH